MVDVHDSNGNSKEEREKDQNVDSAPAAGDGGEGGASVNAGADGEENVTPVAVGVCEEEAAVSEPVDSGDGVLAEAPVGSEESSLDQVVWEVEGALWWGMEGKGCPPSWSGRRWQAQKWKFRVGAGRLPPWSA